VLCVVRDLSLPPGHAVFCRSLYNSGETDAPENLDEPSTNRGREAHELRLADRRGCVTSGRSAELSASKLIAVRYLAREFGQPDDVVAAVNFAATDRSE